MVKTQPQAVSLPKTGRHCQARQPAAGRNPNSLRAGDGGRGQIRLVMLSLPPAGTGTVMPNAPEALPQRQWPSR